MRYSIITPTLNSENTISRTIESVINQNIKDIEYIIIDGGSSDKSIDIINDYISLNKICIKVISEKDNGIFDAMNKGIRMSSGEIIGIINSDDWYNCGTLSFLNLTIFDQNTIYVGDLNLYSHKERFIKTRKNKKKYKVYLPFHMCLNHPSMFVARGVYDRIGLYDKDFNIAADYDFVLRALQEKVNIKIVKKVFANMTMGGVSGLINAKNVISENMLVRKKNNIKPTYLFYIVDYLLYSILRVRETFFSRYNIDE